MDRIRPQQTPGMRWVGKSISLGHKPPVFCNRTLVIDVKIGKVFRRVRQPAISPTPHQVEPAQVSPSRVRKNLTRKHLPDVRMGLTAAIHTACGNYNVTSP